jgi:hypothetical protein
VKLVVRFGIGDGFTWSADIVTPVECESPEQMLVDYENEVKRAVAAYEFNSKLAEETTAAERNIRKKKDHAHELIELWREKRAQERDTNVNLFGHKYSLDQFWSFENKVIYDIEIFTVDEWFEREAFQQTR